MLTRTETPAMRVLFWLSLALYIAVLPLAGTIALRGLAMLGLLVATAWSCWNIRQWPKPPLLLAWLAWLLVALVSLAYAVDADYSLGEIKVEIVYAFLIMLAAHHWIRGEQDLLRLVIIATLANTALVGYSLWLAGETPKGEWVGSWRVGVGTYATYLITVAPLIAALAWRARQTGERTLFAALTLLLVGNLIALFLTLQRQASLGLVVEIATIGGLWLLQGWSRRRLAVVVAALAVATTFFAMHVKQREAPQANGSSAELRAEIVTTDVRWDLWHFALARVAERPFSGGGFGQRAFDLAYPEYHDAHTFLWHAHNMLINTAVQTGLPGLAAQLALLGALVLALFRAWRRGGDSAIWAAAGLAMIMGVLMRNMANDFFQRDNALMFWLFAGALLGALREHAED